MMPFAAAHHPHTGQYATSLTLARAGGLGWLSRALLFSLSCLVSNCTDTNASSSGGAGGATTGGKASSESTSGGASNTASSHASADGGTSVENESGGNPGSSSVATSSATGGADGSKTAATGGSAPAITSGTTAKDNTQSSKGGAANGGATATGGKSSKSSTATSASGAPSSGGKSGSGGATATGGKSGGATGTGGATASGTFTLTSPGWTAMAGCGPDAKTSCPPLPSEITRSGAGTSPELHWSGAPEGTKSFVVVLQDLNNKTAHWILWNIPASVTSLAANVDRTTATPAVPAGSQQCGKGTEAATSDGYYGPGAPCNVYEFVVYALSVEKFSPTSATDQESVRTQLQALGSSILGTASLRGRTNTGC